MVSISFATRARNFSIDSAPKSPCLRLRTATAPIPTIPPSRVSFIPLTTLRGVYREVNQPWSPVGTKFAFTSDYYRQHVVVFDAAQPTTDPIPVYSGNYADKIGWSPDGSWLLVLDITQNYPPPDLRAKLIAVPADGSQVAQVLLEGSSISHPLWAANGKIYYWAPWDATARRELDPPREWADAHPGPFLDHPELLWFPSPNRNTPLLYAFRVTPEPTLEPLTGLNAMVGVGLGPRGEFPDGRRFLANIAQGSLLYSVAVDADGQVLTRFWEATAPPHFAAWSASADSRYVIGADEYAGAGLFLADDRGEWVRPIEGTSWTQAPKASRTGSLVAYMDRLSLRILVGQVAIEPGMSK